VSRSLLDLGGGVEIRVLEPGDADEVFALVATDRQRLRQWMPWVDATTSPTDTRIFIETARASQTDLDGLGIFVEGVYAGGVGLRVEPLNRHAEIGYWIGSAWEGRGLVTRACRAVIRHAFDQLGVHSIEIRVAPHNVRSRAIPERLGFVQEGIQREAGRTDGQGFVDLIVYGLLDREWRG
jgi:ribosomal-protein-serine acetyltransferase